jgi:DNA-binding SARP family transcriptional activator
MKIRILGPVCAMADGIEMPLGGVKQRTVLATLLLARGRVTSNTRLTSLLWDDHPPATATAQIHTYMSRLRNSCRPHIEIVRQPPGYLVRLGDTWFDYQAFEEQSRLGHREMAVDRYEEAVHHFRSALGLWRGSAALANVTRFLSESAGPTLDEARMVVLEARLAAELRMGCYTHLTSELMGLVEEYPFREWLRAQLMTALYRSGRQADALSVYQDGRRLLAEELGIDPGMVLQRTHQAVLTGDLALDLPPTTDRDQSVETRTPLRPSMLPPDVVDFTGRDSQYGELIRLMSRSADGAGLRSVVLITGMPGIGKSALAVRAAHACVDEFPDGQLYVDLGAAGSQAMAPFDALGLLLSVLGVDEWAIPARFDERVSLYRTRLANQRMLILLDGVTCRSQVRGLLPGGQSCQVVITSRSHLAAGLAGCDVINLDVLPAREARHLLGQIVGQGRLADEPAAAGSIVEFCGRLPLALRIVGFRLATHPQWSLTRFANRLVDRTRRLGELQLDDLGVRAGIQDCIKGLDEATPATVYSLVSLDRQWFTARTAATLLPEAPEHVSEKLLETLSDSWLLETAAVGDGYGQHYRLYEFVLCLAHESMSGEAGPFTPVAVIRAAKPASTDARNRGIAASSGGVRPTTSSTTSGVGREVMTPPPWPAPPVRPGPAARPVRRRLRPPAR